MLKKTLLITLSATIFLCSVFDFKVSFPSKNIRTVFAATDFTDGAVTYTVYNNYAVVEKFDSFSATFLGLKLKSKVNGVPVTTIGSKAFYLCTSSKADNLEIPGTVTEIQGNLFSGAFMSCTALTTITIPENVLSIGQNAFAITKNLESITILNPDCEIYSSARTIYNGTDDDDNPYFNGTIYGYSDSTAEEYALKYGYNFKAIDEIQTTTTSDRIATTTAKSTITTTSSVIVTEPPETETPVSLNPGDVNNDGLIDAVDASCILAYYSYTSIGGTESLEGFMKLMETEPVSPPVTDPPPIVTEPPPPPQTQSPVVVTEPPVVEPPVEPETEYSGDDIGEW